MYKQLMREIPTFLDTRLLNKKDAPRLFLVLVTIGVSMLIFNFLLFLKIFNYIETNILIRIN